MIQRRSCIRLIPRTGLLILVFISALGSSRTQNQPDFSFQEISKDSTFDVVTWNIEWFGSSDNGPDDLDLQLNNVIEAIKTLDADLYAFQ